MIFCKKQNCFCWESCAYLHRDTENLVDKNESRSVKLITVEVNGKIFAVEKLHDLDIETTNAMNDDEVSEGGEEVDLDFIEQELNKSPFLNATQDIIKDKSDAENVKLKRDKLNIKKTTRKKSSS